MGCSGSKPRDVAISQGASVAEPAVHTKQEEANATPLMADGEADPATAGPAEQTKEPQAQPVAELADDVYPTPTTADEINVQLPSGRPPSATKRESWAKPRAGTPYEPATVPDTVQEEAGSYAQQEVVQFAKGMCVCLTGLTALKEYEGGRATVINFVSDATATYYTVRLRSADVAMMVHPSNLEAAEEDSIGENQVEQPYTAGQTVRITGLVTMVELEGKLATVLEHRTSKDYYFLRVHATDQVIGLLAVNLTA